MSTGDHSTEDRPHPVLDDPSAVQGGSSSAPPWGPYPNSASGPTGYVASPAVSFVGPAGVRPRRTWWWAIPAILGVLAFIYSAYLSSRPVIVADGSATGFFCGTVDNRVEAALYVPLSCQVELGHASDGVFLWKSVGIGLIAVALVWLALEIWRYGRLAVKQS